MFFIDNPAADINISIKLKKNILAFQEQLKFKMIFNSAINPMYLDINEAF